MNRSALIRKTLADVRGATLGIALVIAAIALLDLAVYPSYKESLADFEIPDALKGFLGEATDLSSPAGFLSAEFFSWVPLLLITLAIVAGSAAFAGEEGAGTLDLLLAQPVKRWRVVVEKTAALTLAVILCALAGLAGFLIGRIWVDIEIGTGRFALATANMIPLVLLFLMLSLWASAALPTRGAAAMLLTGLVIVTYFVQILGEVVPILGTVRKLSPFYWSDASRVLLHGFAWTRPAVFLALAAVCLLMAIWSFERREIGQGGREWSLQTLVHLPRRGRAAQQTQSETGFAQ
jgi:ABC-2 type transport system permease protein